MKSSTLNFVLEARKASVPLVLFTRLDSGDQSVWFDRSAPGAQSLGSTGVSVVDDSGLSDLAADALRRDRSSTQEHDGVSWFVQAFNPPLRMIVVGAVHIAQALVPMAVIAGYEVTVVDPRRAFASDVRFPGVTVSTQWPDGAMQELAPDARTAIVTLTHDPKLDDPALQVALASGAFYIGSLGSRKTHGARLERLAEAGFDTATMSRIAGPIGLNIGASSPAEIAVSIMGQVTATLRADRVKPSD